MYALQYDLDINLCIRMYQFSKYITTSLTGSDFLPSFEKQSSSILLFKQNIKFLFGFEEFNCEFNR